MNALLTLSVPLYYFIVSVAAGILALALSGPVRSAVGLPILHALPIATACALALTIGIRGFRYRPTAARACTVFLLIATFAYEFYRFYYPPFFGLVSVGGGDPGVHAHFQRQFIEEDPNAYHSFTAFFALVYWLQTLFGIELFEAYRAAFYAALFLVMMLMLSLAALLAEREHEMYNRVPVVFLVLFIALAYYPAERIVFPILHYLQAEGFYPQLYGLLPLLLGWYGYTKVERVVPRVLVVLGASALARYTYGLNLPELLFTGALLIGLDLRYLERSNRVAAVLLPAAVALLVLCGMSVSRLAWVFQLEGATVPTNLRSIFFGLTWLSLLFSLYGAGGFLSSDVSDRRVRRIFRFSGLFCLSSAIFALHYADGKFGYYSYKQAILPSLIATFAACLFGAHLCSRLRRLDRFRLIGSVLLLVGTFMGLWEIKEGFEPYRASYRERVTHQPNPTLIYAPIDLAARELIAKTLRDRGRVFGGFVTPSWPISSFMNSAMGYFGEMPFYLSARPPEIPSSCLFWNSDAVSIDELSKINRGGVVKRVRSFAGQAGVVTEKYVRKEDGSPRELSYFCRD